MMMRPARSVFWTFVILFLVMLQGSPARSATVDSGTYIPRTDHWSTEDERLYERFIQAIGESDCATLNECLHSQANLFYGSDPASRRFEADCAQLPYVLRFYYAWKRGLPFSYVNGVTARGATRDIRYSAQGNRAISRRTAESGRPALQIIADIRREVSSANYRIHPESEAPVTPDFYSPAITPASIKPGTMVYDPAGHVAIVYRVDPDGQVHSFDAHTDFTLTQMTFDVRFARARPAQGAGFKNWRPLRLEHSEAKPLRNSGIADFSTEQFYGTGPRPKEAEWTSGSFSLNGESLGFYDFVRARLAGGTLIFDPVKEVLEMTEALCTDLQYRAGAVEMARPMAARPHPARLPSNIYGAEGDWESFSTPSRDARLKTAFVHLRATVQRFVALNSGGNNVRLSYSGNDLAGDLRKTYQAASKRCLISYRQSNGHSVSLTFEEARQRLFAMSFDPYHCPERRWGASGTELASCPDGAVKAAWYEAEQALRNQIERTYDVRMDFTLEELRGSSLGQAAPPDTNVEGYLSRLQPAATK